MKKLRAGIVGLGVMGTNHVRVLSQLDGVELIGVADPQGDIKNVLNGHKIIGSVEELIGEGIDYCVISAPTIFHEEIALQLIESGIHILIEKPISHSFESANRIKLAASKANIIGAVGHIERFNSALKEARKRFPKH